MSILSIKGESDDAKTGRKGQDARNGEDAHPQDSPSRREGKGNNTRNHQSQGS
jgi:hypothetical protein